MKQNYFLKAAGLLAVVVLMSNQVSAQTVPAAGVNIARDAKTVRVIDNKGTVKFLQSNNGITTITNTTSDDVVTTTWQLGGQLTADTYIGTTGQVYALTGLGITSLGSSLDGTAAGYTLLVSDATTGKVERLLATNLIQAGVADDELVANQAAAYTVLNTTGLTAFVNRVSVFRNGIKLREGAANDWILDTTGAAPQVIIAAAVPLVTGDVLNVQWIK